VAERRSERAGSARSGPDIEDLRFGRLAECVGWMTPAQLGTCLHIQKQAARERRPIPRLGEIAVEQGFLGKDQVAALLRLQAVHRPAAYDRTFGCIAVLCGFVSIVQVDAALREQKRLLEETGTAPLLGVLMIEMGLLTAEQAAHVLKQQAAQGKGPLAELKRGLRRAAEAPSAGTQRATAPPRRPGPGDVLYRCKGCSGVLDPSRWLPDERCPVCGATEFVAGAVEERAVAYSLAARDRGPSVEDGRLGLLAFVAGCMTSEEVAHCLEIQRKQAATAPPAERFGQVAVRMGYLTPAQLRALLRMQVIHRPSRYEALFGTLAVKLGLASREQVDTCLREQQRLLREQGEAPRLGVLLPAP